MASGVRRILVATAVVLTACSSSGPSTSSAGTQPASTTGSKASTPAVASGTLPRVDLISAAVTKLEAQLGAPQQYFEINATTRLVNLFVALNDGKLVQPWVYLDGDLSSTQPRDATGFTFAATALDFDPAKVLSHVQTELADSSPDVFFVEAGAGGIVRYSVTVNSKQGGQLVVVVGADGTVQSVDT